MSPTEEAQRVYDALWRMYRRPQPPVLPQVAANLPWDDPEFSERMLREHLDQTHGAASRQRPEILRIVEWLWDKLSLREGARILDVTCGPGLYAVEFARRGCQVRGIDFSPASIAYARDLATEAGVADRCSFELGDVRTMSIPPGSFDAALFLYGQLAIFTTEEAEELLQRCADALREGGQLAIELLDFERIQKDSSTWWYTDNTGLWGDFPFLHLGERHWYSEQNLSLEQFHIINLETGELQDYALTDQAYSTETIVAMLRRLGFGSIEVYPAWGGLQLYDAEEWIAYLAQK
jgi:SAM-dependent methyltransferase